MKVIEKSDSGVYEIVLVETNVLACGCEDGKIRLIHVDSGELIGTLKGHTNDVFSLLMINEDRLVSGSEDNLKKSGTLKAESASKP